MLAPWDAHQGRLHDQTRDIDLAFVGRTRFSSNRGFDRRLPCELVEPGRSSGRQLHGERSVLRSTRSLMRSAARMMLRVAPADLRGAFFWLAKEAAPDRVKLDGAVCEMEWAFGCSRRMDLRPIR